MGIEKAVSRCKSVLVVLVVFALAVTGCVGSTPPEPKAETPVGIEIEQLDGSELPTAQIASPQFTNEALPALEESIVSLPISLGLDVIFSAPVELTTDEPLPAEGVVLTKHFAEPIPREAVASFAYFNEELQTWIAVPTEVSADRRTLSATVHHFSLWTTFISGPQKVLESLKKSVENGLSDAYDFLKRGAKNASEEISKALLEGIDAAYYAAGNAVGTRVDAPICPGPLPDWVDEIIHIEEHRNNPIRFCTGMGSTENLQVKASNNRSYAFPYTLNVRASSSQLSSQSGSMKNIKDTILGLDQNIATSISDLFTADGVIPPGQTLTANFAQSSVGSAADSLLLSMRQPTVPVFLISTAASMLVQTGLAMDASWVTAVLGLGQCMDDVAGAGGNLAGGAKAALSCISGQEEFLAGLIAKGAINAGTSNVTLKLAGRFLGSLSMWMVLVSASSAGLDYAMQSQTDDSSLQVRAWAQKSQSLNNKWSATSTNFIHLDPWNNPEIEILDAPAGREQAAMCGYSLGSTTTVTCVSDVACVHDFNAQALCRPDRKSFGDRISFDLTKWVLKSLPAEERDETLSGSENELGLLIALELADGRICVTSTAGGAIPPPGFSGLWGICSDNEIVWLPDPNNELQRPASSLSSVSGLNNPFLDSSTTSRLKVAVSEDYVEDPAEIDVVNVYY